MIEPNFLSDFDNQVAGFEQSATSGTSLGGTIPQISGNTIPDAVSSAANAATNAATSAGSGATDLLPSITAFLLSTRVIAVVLGLIAIGGAIFLFGASELFQSDTAKSVAKGAIE